MAGRAIHLISNRRVDAQMGMCRYRRYSSSIRFSRDGSVTLHGMSVERRYVQHRRAVWHQWRCGAGIILRRRRAANLNCANSRCTMPARRWKFMPLASTMPGPRDLHAQRTRRGPADRGPSPSGRRRRSRRTPIPPPRAASPSSGVSCHARCRRLMRQAVADLFIRHQARISCHRQPDHVPVEHERSVKIVRNGTNGGGQRRIITVMHPSRSEAAFQCRE